MPISILILSSFQKAAMPNAETGKQKKTIEKKKYL